MKITSIKNKRIHFKPITASPILSGQIGRIEGFSWYDEMGQDLFCVACNHSYTHHLWLGQNLFASKTECTVASCSCKKYCKDNFEYIEEIEQNRKHKSNG